MHHQSCRRVLHGPVPQHVRCAGRCHEALPQSRSDQRSGGPALSACQIGDASSALLSKPVARQKLPTPQARHRAGFLTPARRSHTMRQVMSGWLQSPSQWLLAPWPPSPCDLSNHAIPSLQTTAAACQSVHAISDQSAFISHQLESIRC